MIMHVFNKVNITFPGRILSLLFLHILLSNINTGYAQANNESTLLGTDVSYARKTERTCIFSRAQFKYSLGNDEYLNRWVDRPLLVDAKLDNNKAANDLMSLQAYEQMQQTALNYGLDGFSFFPQTTSRAKIYALTKESSVKNFQLLSEFTGNNVSKADVIRLALDNAASFKINGKVVITSYNADEDDLASWQSNLASLKQQYSSQFIFLPSVTKFAGKPINFWQKKFHNHKLTAEDINSIKNYLRQWAQATDGLYFSNVISLYDEHRNFDNEFYRDFVVRLMKSVLNEPGLKDKYFGLSACIGHENATRFGYTLSSNGTKTLRQSMETALNAKPDIINIPEWDEQNENTSLRPTVYNGSSSMRIIRYYTAVNKNESLASIPNDNTGLPNLIISYRKTLTLGEKLSIELLNVPDGTEKSTYNTVLILKDLKGNTIYQSSAENFSVDKLNDITITLPTETYAGNNVLIPELEIKINNKTININEGLQYIELRPTWNWDYKWVKQPVRDLLNLSKINFQASPDANNSAQLNISASVIAEEPLAQVEVLNNNNVVYSYAANNNWHEDDKQVILSFTMQAFKNSAQQLNGTISLQNATGKWFIPKTINNASAAGQVLSFNNMKAGVQRQRILLVIPRLDIAKGNLSVQLPGIFTGIISLEKIMHQGIIGFSGADAFNLVISNYLRQNKIPENLNLKNVEFSVPVIPDMPASVYHLQLISVSGKIYRSTPVSAPVNDNTSKTTITVYSDTKNAPVSISVNKNEVPNIIYEFNPQHGSVFITNAGRCFWGILGGYFAQATEVGGGNLGDDIPFIDMKDYPDNTHKTAPDWITLDDKSYALQFDGKGTFISLPQGAIPRRAGYSIDMNIYPEETNGQQTIIAQQSVYLGSISIFSDNGTLKVSFSGENTSIKNASTGLSLSKNQWNHLKINYDQQNLTVEVNGTKGKTISVPGPGLYETATVVGGYGSQWFKGKIKSLSIKHG